MESNLGMKKRHTFIKLVLWFIGLCLVLEVGLRPFGYGNYTIYRPDERLLWVPVAGRTLTVVNHLPITINDQGFRYPVDVRPKEKGEFRVIAFGDSSTQGWGVDDNSHYSAILQKMMNGAACPRESVEVISAGVNAYPNSLVAEKLKQVVEANVVQPDVAIVAYSYNSNFEKLPTLQGAEREKFLRRVAVKSIVRRSALYNFLIEGVLRRVAYYQLRHLVIAGSLATINGSFEPDVTQFNAGLTQSLELCRRHNIQMVLLLLGSQGETAPEHPFQKAMVEFAQAHQVPLLNMIDVVRTKDQDAMFMDPAHPTAAGHRLIAEQLFKTIHALPNYESACQTNAATANVTSAVSPGTSAR
jgi:lysophospholipase L1-like esterase